MPSILIVEDEIAIADTLLFALQGEGFGVQRVALAQEALATLRAIPIDLVILDVGLPDMSGFECCKALRRFSAVPVMFLTARAEEVDRVVGLEIGADDYVVKPVDLHELAARLRALVRRAHGQPQECLTAQDVVLDPASRTVRKADVAIALSNREFALLQAFMLSAGRVLSREQLEQQLYSWGQEVDSNAIEVHIHNLRRKLGNTLIHTVRGVGYTLMRDAPAP
ncbi:MAG TPA: response regulator [Rhodoferax sp.]|mgnify:CR=1 FL=1|nr:response regulator [Rhodoferax sp.]